jgi:hypothetical protein
MLTVRFSDGFSIQYNDADLVTHTPTHHTLWRKRSETERDWIANVPLSCVVEGSRPCSISNPIRVPSDTLQWVIDNLRELNVYKLAALKRALADFNIQKKRWK